jgi:hypothetical protein
MKVVNSILSAVFALSAFSASAFAVGPQDAAGTWNLVDRTCSDGSQATDAFQLGRDEMTLKINEPSQGIASEVVANVRINNQYSVSIGSTDFDGTIKFQNSEGKIENIPYTVFGNYKMVIETSGFGEGGSCKPGQTLSFLFQRI